MDFIALRVVCSGSGSGIGSGRRNRFLNWKKKVRLTDDEIYKRIGTLSDTGFYNAYEYCKGAIGKITSNETVKARVLEECNKVVKGGMVSRIYLDAEFKVDIVPPQTDQGQVGLLFSPYHTSKMRVEFLIFGFGAEALVLPGVLAYPNDIGLEIDGTGTESPRVSFDSTIEYHRKDKKYSIKPAGREACNYIEKILERKDSTDKKIYKLDGFVKKTAELINKGVPHGDIKLQNIIVYEGAPYMIDYSVDEKKDTSYILRSFSLLPLEIDTKRRRQINPKNWTLSREEILSIDRLALRYLIGNVIMHREYLRANENEQQYDSNIQTLIENGELELLYLAKVEGRQLSIICDYVITDKHLDELASTSLGYSARRGSTSPTRPFLSAKDREIYYLKQFVNGCGPL